MSIDFVTRNVELFMLLGVILAMLAWDVFRRSTSGVKSVSPLELPQLTRDASVIVDVSAPGEFKKGHIPQSINLPHKKLVSDDKALEKHKKKNVLVVCRAGNHSTGVVRHLMKKGFENVYVLAGGMLAWEKEKLPVERG